jgi:CRP-like cAMP-binding protein
MNEKTVLVGKLAFLSLPELLQLLGASGSTGILRIKNGYAKGPALVYFLNGNLINAHSGVLNGLDALYSLFGWTQGEFEFSQEAVKNKKVITKSHMEIILDGLRMLDDGDIERLGPASFEARSSGKGSSLPLIMRPIAHYMHVVEEEEFVDGVRIVEEGKYGNWIWVVLKGVADIVKETPEGPVTLLRIGHGGFIGNMSSIFRKSYSRTATVVASGDVQLGVLDTQPVYTEYSSISNEFKGLLLSLDNRLKQVMNRTAETHLKNSNVEDIIKRSKPVIKRSKKEKKVLEITQGEASVLRHTKDGYVLLAQLKEGDVMGHIPFLDIGHEPHSSAVYGSKDLEVRALDPDELQREYDQLSPTFKNIIEFTASCTSVATLMACRFHSSAPTPPPPRPS